MPARPLLFALLLLLLPACARDHETPRPSAQSEVPQPRPVPAVVAEGPDTAGCGAIPKQQFAEPEQLVHEWVRRDTLGYFLGSDERLFELMACPGHLGGGDVIVIATGPRVIPAGTAADTVSFLLTYRRFGFAHADTSGTRMTFDSEHGIDSVLVRTVRTAFGWRFPFDVAPPHLSPATALRVVEGEWVPASRDSLAALAARPAP